MRKILFCIIVALAISSCSSDTEDSSFTTAPIEEDYSYIVDPQERWKAYHLENYSIDQAWYCFCPTPNQCTSFIINDSILDVDYEPYKDSDGTRNLKEIYDYVLYMAKTVDEVFDLIDRYRTVAFKMEVEYDARFGFPTMFSVDYDSMMIDDEMTRRFSNLKKIK